MADEQLAAESQASPSRSPSQKAEHLPEEQHGYGSAETVDDHEGSETSHQEPEGPPPPLLIVDRSPDPPALISVDSSSMSVQWNPASTTFESQPGRVLEFILSYALEMQMVEVDTASGQPTIHEDRWSTQYSGPATYVQVKGLRPGRNYAVRVACQPIVTDPEVVIQLASPSGILVVATPPTPPCAPAAPVLSVRQRYMLKFKWAEPAENGGHPIQTYVFECYPPPEDHPGQPGPDGMYELYRGLDLSITLKRLLPGVRYTARVKAINAIGESPWSLPAAFSTQASVPSTPDAPAVASAGADSVVLLWPPVAGNGAEVTGYQVEMDDGEGGEMVFAGRSNEAQFSLAGLRSGLTYRFRVRAENSEGYSMWTTVCEARTAATPPQAPRPPARSHATHSSISLSWSPPDYDGGSAVQRYELEMQPKCAGALRDMAPEWLRVYEGKEPISTIGGLRAGCTYRVRGRAINSVGAGPYSIAVDVSTTPACPEAPTVLAAASRSQDSLVMTWNPPLHNGGADINSYKLEYRVLGPVEQPPEGVAAAVLPLPSSSYETIYEGAERKATLQGLLPGTKYEFRCAAANKQGPSSWTKPVTAETKPGVPLVPATPTIAAGNVARSLQLHWKPPYGQGALVNSYVVQMRPLEEPSVVAKSAAALAVAIEHQQVVDVADIVPQGNGHARGPSSDGSGSVPPPDTPGAEPASSTDANPHEAAFTTVYHGSDPQCTVIDLEPNSEYVFRIKACNAVGGSAWSDEHIARTAPAAPTPPVGLHLTAATQNSLQLAWNVPNLDNGALIIAYQLDYALYTRGQRAANTVWKPAYSGEALSKELVDLRPGQNYRFRARARNSCGWSQWTPEVSASTEAGAPGAPPAPTTSSRSSTSVRLSWEPPLETNGAVVTSYQLQYTQKASTLESASVMLYSGPDVTFKATGLSAGTQYSFQVRAVNAAGFGPWSELTSVITSLAPPLKPTQVNAIVDRGAGILITWEHPNSSANTASCTAFEVEATSTSGSTSARSRSGAGSRDSKPAVVKQTCSAKLNELRLTDLREGCSSWSVRVRGIGADGAGHGQWSESAEASLPAAAVGAETLTAAPKADNSAAVTQRNAHRSRRLSTDSAASSASLVELAGQDDGTTRGRPVVAKPVAAKPKPRQKTWSKNMVTHASQHLGMREGQVIASLRAFISITIILAIALFFWSSRK